MDRDHYGDELAVVTATPAPDGALDRFLDTLQTATTRLAEVVIAETAHPDGSPAPAGLTAARSGVRWVRIGEDVGFAAAVNRAAMGLGAEIGWVAAAVPEVRWEPGALDVLRAAAARWPRAGVLVPRLRDEAGNDHPPRPPRRFGRSGSVTRRVRAALAWALLDRVWSLGSAPVEEGPIDAAPVACLLLRRTAFDSVDGFDPRYRSPLAGADLGDRVTRAGWRCIRVPAAGVTAPVPTVDPVVGYRDAVRYVTDRVPGPWRAMLRVALGR